MKTEPSAKSLLPVLKALSELCVWIHETFQDVILVAVDIKEMAAAVGAGERNRIVFRMSAETSNAFQSTGTESRFRFFQQPRFWLRQDQPEEEI